MAVLTFLSDEYLDGEFPFRRRLDPQMAPLSIIWANGSRENQTLNIVVCGKVIPASSVTIEIDPNTKRMMRKGVTARAGSCGGKCRRGRTASHGKTWRYGNSDHDGDQRCHYRHTQRIGHGSVLGRSHSR